MIVPKRKRKSIISVLRPTLETRLGDIVEKQQNGLTQKVKLLFIKPWERFRDPFVD